MCWALKRVVYRPKSPVKYFSSSADALDLSQRIGGPDAETRAFQVIATLEGGMMLARAYQDTDAFDQAVAGLV